MTKGTMQGFGQEHPILNSIYLKIWRQWRGVASTTVLNDFLDVLEKNDIQKSHIIMVWMLPRRLWIWRSGVLCHNCMQPPWWWCRTPHLALSLHVGNRRCVVWEQKKSLARLILHNRWRYNPLGKYVLWWGTITHTKKNVTYSSIQRLSQCWHNQRRSVWYCGKMTSGSTNAEHDKLDPF